MSRENVEIVRSTLDAFAAGDQDRMLASVDREVVIDASRRVINPTTYFGIEGVRQLIDDMGETWEDLRIDQREVIDAGDRVAVIGRLTGKGKSSGVEVERPVNGQVWTMRNGRIVRLEFGFTDREATLEAAGLLEATAVRRTSAEARRSAASTARVQLPQTAVTVVVRGRPSCGRLRRKSS